MIAIQLSTEFSIGDLVSSKVKTTENEYVVTGYEIEQITMGMVTAYKVKCSDGTGNWILFHPFEIKKIGVIEDRV